MWKCSYASRDKKKGRAKGEVLGIKSGGTEAVPPDFIPKEKKGTS